MAEQNGNLHKCAHPDCNEMVGPDDLCHGCHEYTCTAHSGSPPFKDHNVEDHWDNCDVCGEHVSVCHCEEESDD